jgi:hypothetical protein
MGAIRRARTRLTLAVGVLILWSALVVPPAFATPARGVPTHAQSVNGPPVSIGRKVHVYVRGRVDVSHLERSRRGAPTPSSYPDEAESARVQSRIQAGPPVDLGSTNTTVSPSLLKLGLTIGDADTPNPMVAVGPDHVIRSDDGQMRITNRSGGDVTTVPYADLFPFLGEVQTVHGPQGQVFFDAVHGRWVAIVAAYDCIPETGAPYGHGYLAFAVSDSANPKRGWTLYYIQNVNHLVWNPGLGTSADKIVLTSQFQRIGTFCLPTGSPAFDATVIDWADLLGHEFEATYFPFPAAAGKRIDKLSPAIRRDGASETLELFAQVFRTGTSDYATWLYRISGPGSDAAIAGVDLTSLDVVPAFGQGTTINQGDTSFSPASGPTSVVAQGERLVASLTETCLPPADTTVRNCVRIVDLGTSTATPTRRQDFFLARNGKHTFSPGLAFTETDELIITFQRASDSEGPSAYVVRQAPTDVPKSVSPTRTLATAQALYKNLNAAEVVGLSPDPLVPDAVWVINQAGKSADPEAYSLQVAQARTATGDTYAPITPLRVLDTRDGIGLSGAFLNNIARSFDVAGEGTIPPDAVAITGNLTVTGQGSAGYVSVGPTISANPTSSTINFPLGDNRANNLTLPLNANGALMAVFKGAPTKSTQLILDVTGYFLADNSGATYKPLTAARVLDSRVGTGLSGKFAANMPRSFQVSGVGGVPVGATAVTGNLTVVGQSRAGYVSVTPTEDPDPDTSTINFPLGDIRANGLTVPLSATGSLSAVYKANGGSTDLILDVTGYYLDDLAGLKFYPLNPGRIMDTRFNTLTQLFGPFSSSVPRTLVTGGHFGVPANALAVTGNLTVVGQTKAGYVSITKNPVATPPVSTINFPFGDVRANGVTVPLNAANDMALVYKASSGAKTHLILDLTGYFK